MRFFLALAHCQPATDEALARRLLTQFHSGREGKDLVFARPAPDVLLGVAGVEAGESSSAFVTDGGRFTVAADGALYYLADLARAIRDAGGVVPAPGASTGQWIQAALTTWGPGGASRLEGEFVFVAWDGVERRLIAARDHTGMWPLFYAPLGRGVAAASSPRLLRRLPGMNAPINMVAVVDDSANLESVGPTETAFHGISRIPSSYGMDWSEGRVPRLFQIFETPLFDRDSGVPFTVAAEELRELIVNAVRERTSPSRTSVALSGGYDSTAIFGAGNLALRREKLPALSAVSLSFPPGDPGRENEWILTTAAQWGVTPQWLDTEEIPALDRAAERAAARDEPMAHPYDLWNEALAQSCRSTGSNVLFTGVGGDGWFSGSPIFYADLLRRGRLLQLRREWTEHLAGTGDAYGFFKVAVQPNIPEWASRGIAMLRGGRRLKPLTYSPIPVWFSSDFVSRERLVERQFAVAAARRPKESHFSAERAWFLDNQTTPRVIGLVQSAMASAGISLRLPLMDWRVIQFSATRPRSESVSGASNKHLLRAAVKGLVPDEVLAARTHRTGVPSSYFDRVGKAYARLLQDILAGGMLLANYGVVKPDVLDATTKSVLGARTLNPKHTHQLILLAQTELWLKTEVEG